MDVEKGADEAVCKVAAAIGEPARARMLYCLMDDRARTSTELAVVADVSPSTASVHLNRLREERLVRVFVQGKHRYYNLEGPDVAHVLEGLSVLAGSARTPFAPTTPKHLLAARTCYDHLAGTLGVLLHDRLISLGWLVPETIDHDTTYTVTPKGGRMFETLGVDLEATRSLRRRFAFGCLDWSERRSHLGGAMGAALLKTAFKKRWVTQDLDSRSITLTPNGRRELLSQFGIRA